MFVISNYEIVIKTYQGEPVGRIRFEKEGSIEESALYSLSELSNLILLLEQGELVGSFAVGCLLQRGARFQLVSE